MSSPYVPLPRGLVDPRKAAGRVFDDVAAIYDVARPGYPAAAFADLTARCGLGPGDRVLEIGCGTGQATRDLARCGCAIDCLEPGPALADIARKNLADTPAVHVRTSTFEAAAEEPAGFNVVVSATAFHWIDPNVSFAKAARLLCPGGSLALLTNIHGFGGSQEHIAAEMRVLHRKLAPELGGWAFPSVAAIRERAATGGDIAAVWSRVERKLGESPSVSHLFEPPVVSTYPWLAAYDRQGYVAMLATQSSYALLEPAQRDELLHAIGQLVDARLDGLITKQYVTVLATAKRV